MTWLHYVYSERLKAHVLPGPLTEIHEEYAEDGYELHPATHPNPKIITEAYLDIGGPAYAHRPIEVFFVDGLELCLASAEIPLFMETWLTLPRRKTRMTSSGYYKLHGMFVALVLTPAHYQALMAHIQERMPFAKQRADEFDAQHPPVADVIAEANRLSKRGPVQ
jgi:hypothetical protein